jgi:hypothetical protein
MPYEKDWYDTRQGRDHIRWLPASVLRESAKDAGNTRVLVCIKRSMNEKGIS